MREELANRRPFCKFGSNVLHIYLCKQILYKLIKITVRISSSALLVTLRCNHWPKKAVIKQRRNVSEEWCIPKMIMMSNLSHLLVPFFFFLSTECSESFAQMLANNPGNSGQIGWLVICKTQTVFGSHRYLVYIGVILNSSLNSCKALLQSCRIGAFCLFWFAF